MLEKSEDELLSLRNFGRKSYDELRDKLAELGLLPPRSPEESYGDYGDDDDDDSIGGVRDGGDAEGGGGEDLSPLGAALIEALREAGEDPSDLIRRKENE